MAKKRNRNTKKAGTDKSLSISKNDLDNGPLEYVELEDYPTDDGHPKRLYFRPCPTALRLPIEDGGKTPREKWNLMLDALAWCTVDPETRQPIMAAEEWNWKDIKLQRFAISAVLDISFEEKEDEDEDEELDRLELEQVKEIEELAKDPNPFVETTGTDSPTTYTES